MVYQVVMYSTPWCGDCRAASDFLDRHNVEYKVVNIEDDDEAMKLVIQVNHGKRSVPTFDIDGQYLNCSPFTIEKRNQLAQALGIVP